MPREVRPGGGFSYVGSVHDSFPHAVAISSAGYNASGLGHGFGLGTGTSAEGWVIDVIRFWETSLRG